MQIHLLTVSFLLQQLGSSFAFAPNLPKMMKTTTTTASSSTSASPASAIASSNARSPVSVVSMTAEDDDGDQEMTTNDETAAVRVEPDTHDELMYCLGVNLARQLGDIRPLVEDGEELAQVAKGLLDTVVGRLNDDGQRLLLAKRGTELDALIVSRANSLRVLLEARGREMLENMGSTEGVKKLDNGVILHVLEHGPEGEGEGSRPTQGSVVSVQYHGTLSDGTVFDSTLGGDNVNFPLAQVIPGWRDGILQMHEGETAMLGIPPDQAYGAEGTPDGRIPGGSTLFFKIQLIEIMSAAIGGSPLLGADGKGLKKGKDGGSGLVGVDGNPLK